jgi:hypothetical protein
MVQEAAVLDLCLTFFAQSIASGKPIFVFAGLLYFGPCQQELLFFVPILEQIDIF